MEEDKVFICDLCHNYAKSDNYYRILFFHNKKFSCTNADYLEREYHICNDCIDKVISLFNTAKEGMNND